MSDTKSAEVVDLMDSDVEGKPAPKYLQLAANCFEILDSDDEGNGENMTEDDRKLPAIASKKRVSPTSVTENGGFHDGPKLKKAAVSNDTINATTDDAEVEAFVPEDPTLGFASLPSKDSQGEDEVAIIGSIGNNPLADFPHARENCVVHHFHIDPQKHCNNCFCYVCDDRVAACPCWNVHCVARHGEAKWQLLRQQAQGKTAPAAPTTFHSAQSSFTPFIASSFHDQRVWNDKQRRFAKWVNLNAANLVKQIQQVYPAEVSPPSPPFASTLRHYQMQSLAFMLNIEKNESVKSGWQCSEVGMGKTAVVIALVAMNPSIAKSAPSASHTMKGTLIITSISLLAQWEAEVQKHAPGLRVAILHPPSGKNLTSAQIAAADIIVSSATFHHKVSYNYHRIVIDESHLVKSSSIRTDCLKGLRTDRRWCVSATPFPGFLEQAEFLKLTRLMVTAPTDQRMAFLKKHMIRHTKSQSINGAAALHLPPTTTTCKKISMSESDRRRYIANESTVGSLASFRSLKPTYIFMNVYSLLQSQVFYLVPSPKIQALREDLSAMLTTDPNMRAVVYTQFRSMQTHVEQCIKSLGIRSFSFSGSTPAIKRHKFIKEFQSTAGTGPAVFCVTMGSGSVGMTLTAASHVFLLEPCLDPATETQAAGRINRLGQTKTIEVTKYVYESSFESNIVDMHEQLKSGAIAMTEEGAFPRAAMQILGKMHRSSASSDHNASLQTKASI